MRTLPNKYSSGPENIPNILLKKLHSSLALPLSLGLIFQQSINTGCLPKLWKCAKIVPVNKGNSSKYCVENYRPIRLTSNVCKLMESTIYDEIYNHCLTNNLLSDSQHRFRKKNCTISNLLELNNDLTKFFDDNNSVDLITIDFFKAFNKIPHKKLLHKLINFSIDGCVFNWIKDFLCEINFNVRISSYFSNLFDVNNSVPQGSN